MFRSKVHKDNRKANETKKDDAEPQVYDQSDESDASNRAAHIEIQFPDTTTDFYCKIYFSAAFKQLRSYVMPDGEMGFIRYSIYVVLIILNHYDKIAKFWVFRKHFIQI